jgi:hypothetical protein
VVKELTEVRAIHRREARANAKEDYHDTMPTMELAKQISRLKQKPECDQSDGENDKDEEWTPPIPI